MSESDQAAARRQAREADEARQRAESRQRQESDARRIEAEQRERQRLTDEAAPDADKLLALASALDRIEMPITASKKARELVNQYGDEISRIAKLIRLGAEGLSTKRKTA